MKLLLTKHGGKLIDANGQEPTIDAPLAFHGETREHVRVILATEDDYDDAPVSPLSISRDWVANALHRAFYFDGFPVPIEEIDDENSERGAVVRALTPSPIDPVFNAICISAARKGILASGAMEAFLRLFRERAPEFMQELIQDAVQDEREEVERLAARRKWRRSVVARMTLPWSAYPIPYRKRQSRTPQHLQLSYYLAIQARELRGENREVMFDNSASALTKQGRRTRYFDGRAIFDYFRFFRLR